MQLLKFSQFESSNDPLLNKQWPLRSDELTKGLMQPSCTGIGLCLCKDPYQPGVHSVHLGFAEGDFQLLLHWCILILTVNHHV